MLAQELLQIAKEHGVEPTQYFERIVKAKERFGLGVLCPCDKDNKERYCISPLCMSDIEQKGTCHCCAYKLKEK